MAIIIRIGNILCMRSKNKEARCIFHLPDPSNYTSWHNLRGFHISLCHDRSQYSCTNCINSIKLRTKSKLLHYCIKRKKDNQKKLVTISNFPTSNVHNFTHLLMNHLNLFLCAYLTLIIIFLKPIDFSFSFFKTPRW